MKTPEELDKEADELFATVYGSPDEIKDTEPEDNVNVNNDEAKPSQPVEEIQNGTQDAPASDHHNAEDITVANAQERIKNAQARMTKATQEAAELRRENDALLAEFEKLRSEIASLKQSPPKESDTEAKKDVDLEYLREEYPDLMNPLVNIISRQDEQLRELRNRLDGVSTAITTADENAAMQTHWSNIYSAHPDAQEISSSDDFLGWLSRQPSAVQTIAESGTSEDVVWLLDQYKGTLRNDKPSDTQSHRVAAAKSIASPRLPKSGSPVHNVQTGPRFTRDQIKNMSPEEFSKYEKEIDAAMSKGLIW